MVRGHVGEQEVEGHRLDGAVLPDLLRDGADSVLVERHVYRTIGHDPLVHLVAVAALDQRLRLDPGDVVVAPPVAPLDEGDVAKALGRHVGHPGALALEDRVGRDRGPEPDVADVRRCLEAPEAAENAFVGVVRRGENLPHVDRPGLRIVAHEIRERAADVDTDQIVCQTHSPTRLGERQSRGPGASSVRMARPPIESGRRDVMGRPALRQPRLPCPRPLPLHRAPMP